MKVSLILGLLSIALAIIHVEPQRSVQTINIRLGERAPVNYPSFPFRDVYVRNVRKYPDERRPFNVDDICQEDPTRIDLKELAYYSINPPRPKKAVIFELEDILSSQSVADATIANQRVYVAFRNASILTLDTHDINNLSKVGLWTAPAQTNFEEGQFFPIKGGQETLFITDLKLYLTSRDGLVPLEGYRPLAGFQSAICMQDKYFAIAAGATGISFYEFIGQRQGVRYLETLGSAAIGRQNFHAEDIATDGKGTLFMIDRNFGMLMANISIQNSRVKTDMLPQVVRKRNCDNIVYNQGDVYMTCNKVYRYGVHTDSIDAQLPDPLFKVKELFAYSNMLVIMGENDFKVYHNDRLVEDIATDNMDKFLINKNQYLAVNEWGVSYGNYTIKQPVVSCETRDPHNEGVLNVLLTTEAECSLEYLSNRNIDLNATINDTCLYTTPVQLVFWSPKDLSLVPFLVMTILLSTLLITIGLWMLLVKRREWQLKHALTGFHMPGSRSQYDVMVEQAPNPNDIVDKDKPAVELQPTAPAPENKKTGEKPAGQQQYDIGD